MFLLKYCVIITLLIFPCIFNGFHNIHNIICVTVALGTIYLTPYQLDQAYDAYVSDYGTDMRRVVASPHSTPHVVIFNSDVSELLDEVEQVTNEALRAALRVELVNIHKEFGDHALIDMFWREIKSLDRKYLNQIHRLDLKN